MIVYLLCIPHASVETGGSTMQVVRTIIHSKAIFFAIKCELSVADTIAIASNKCAKEWFWRVDAVVDVIVSLNDVGIVAIAVGHHDGHKGTSIVCYSYFHAAGIA